MNKILPHIAWLAVAAGAFAAGRFLTSQPEASGADSAAVATPVVAADSDRSATGQPESAAAAAAKFVDDFRVAATGRLNPKGMGDAVTEALRESDPVKSSLMFAMLMEELTTENAAAAREAIVRGAAGFDSFRYLGLLNYKWGAIDGNAAVAAAQESGDRRESFMGTGMALAGWASSNPEAALAWMETQEQERQQDGDEQGQGRGFGRGGQGGFGGPQDMWMRSIISGLAGTDPERATELALEASAANPDSARGYAEAIAREMLKGGTLAAEKWMQGISDPNLKQGALRAIGEHMARLDPADAANWIGNYADVEGADRVIGDIVNRWTDNDPQAALGWVNSLQPGQSQNQGMREVFSEWSQEDPTAASQHLATMSNGAAKDYAITGLVRSTLREEPDAALPWAQTISDTELRNQTIVQAASAWFRRDQEAAAAWMASANLTPDVQEAIIAPPQRGERGGNAGFQLFEGGGGGGRGGGRFGR